MNLQKLIKNLSYLDLDALKLTTILGNTLKEYARLEDALENYNKSLSLKPDYAEAYCNMSYIYNLYGNLKKGLELYEWRQKQQKTLL